MKTCRVCGKEKELEEFVRNNRRADGYDSRCLECDRIYKYGKMKEREEEIKAHRKAYREQNAEIIKLKKQQDYINRKEAVLAHHRRYYKTHKEQILAQIKEYRATHSEWKRAYDKQYVHEHFDVVRVYKRQYYEKHREVLLAQARRINKMRRSTDVWYRLRTGLGRRVGSALCGALKSARTMSLVGCSSQELRVHLEEQFQEGMTWDNYGYRGWHIDHIRPCATFDLTDPEQQKICFHYTNLQPMWALDNIKKGAKWDGPMTRKPYQRRTKIGA